VAPTTAPVSTVAVTVAVPYGRVFVPQVVAPAVPRTAAPSSETVPMPLAGRSLFRSVIETTSGPIGRRLVALTGVLFAIVLGIAAAKLDDRMQIISRLQARRHVDDPYY
jgi:hypothetical protein